MTRKLCLGFALLLTAATTAWGQGLQESFQEGVDLFRRGHRDEALSAFQRALADEPTTEEAYALWNSIEDSEVWVDLMTAGGGFELVAKRVLALAKSGRLERRDDADAIRGLLESLRNEDNALERRKLIRKLAADHGAYAVPYLIPALANPADDDWRVLAMHALTQMDTDVVLPLVEALHADEPYLRRNVALVLGYVGDRRAAGVLTALASGDPDGSVQEAAREAAQRCGSNGDALSLFLRNGDDYYNRRSNVLPPYAIGDVVWSWTGGDLVAESIPRAIYHDELSRRAYFRALAVDPSSIDALAGIARAYTDMEAKLQSLSDAGEDVDELLARASEGSLAIASTGVDALDRALQWSVVNDDAAAATRLCRSLGPLATQPTQGLQAALESSDGGVRGEAAVALGNIAWQAAQPANLAVVRGLGDAAGREVVRVAGVIDANLQRADALVSALSAEGVLVNHRGTGASGLAMLHRLPGLDVLLVGDGLPDMTLDQVLGDVARNPVTAGIPVYLATGDAELADAYSARVAGTIADAAGLSVLDEEVFSTSLTGDRAQADELAGRAASVLAGLARAGRTDVGPALDALTRALGRDDAVTLPALRTLGAAGTPAQISALVAVAADGERSDEARAAAADAVGGILARHPAAGAQAAELRDVLASDASLEVRQAAARAIGRARLDPAQRAELVRAAGQRLTE